MCQFTCLQKYLFIPLQQETQTNMTTITVLLPNPNKAGHQLYYKIKFAIADFDVVVEKIQNIKTLAQLESETIWSVI